MQDPSEPVLNVLLELSAGNDPRIRSLAQVALRASIEKHQSTIATLLVAVDVNHTIRWAAARSLGRLREASSDTIGALTLALDDSDPKVRLAAAHSLSRLNQLTSEAAEVLREALEDPKAATRKAAARSLERLSEASPYTLEALRKALGDNHAEVRVAAATSLGKIEKYPSPDLSEMYIDGLRSEQNWALRRDCADLLGRIQEHSERAIDALYWGLTDDDDDVRTACATALATLGRRHSATADDITTKLVQALEDPLFESLDSVVHRSGQDYAFDSLWMLLADEPVGSI